jgi:hypothetical protein
VRPVNLYQSILNSLNSLYICKHFKGGFISQGMGNEYIFYNFKMLNESKIFMDQKIQFLTLTEVDNDQVLDREFSAHQMKNNSLSDSNKIDTADNGLY